MSRVSTRPNPFRIEPAAAPAPTRDDGLLSVDDAILGAGGETHGPVLPPGASAAANESVLVAGGTSPAETITVVSLHGGAGATTVCRLLGRDAERFGWIEGPSVGAVPEHGAALLVARTSGAGMECAHAAAREWGEGSHPGLALLGLVLVADGPRTPTELRAGTKRLARMFPRAWRIEWVPEWHLRRRPDLERIPWRAQGARKKITRWAAERGLDATPKEKK